MVGASLRAGTMATTRGQSSRRFGPRLSSLTRQKYPRATRRYTQIASGIAERKVGDRDTRYSAIGGNGTLCQIFRANGKAPNSLPGRRENRIAHGRGNYRQSGFADAGRLFLAHDHVNFSFRRLANPRHLVVVEIRLLHAASIDRDRVMQSGRESVDSRALDLRANAFRIDRPAAIHGVNDTLHLHGAVFHTDFDDSSGVTLKGIVSGDAARNSLWERLAPSSFLRRQAQHALQTSRVERLAFLRVGEIGYFAILSDEAQAKFQRVGAGRSSEFIHKRFDHEAARGMLDGAPPGARHGRLCERVFDTVVRRLIRNERGGSKFGLFRILFALGVPHRFDGGGSLEMFPGGEIALRIESARKMVIRGGAIETVLHVVFAGPKYHDRLAGNFCHLRRFHNEVRLIAPAKASAHQGGMNDHFLGRKFCSLSDDLLRPLRSLRRHPRFRAVRPD